MSVCLSVREPPVKGCISQHLQQGEKSYLTTVKYRECWSRGKAESVQVPVYCKSLRKLHFKILLYATKISVVVASR
jgi:hypothetical protein